MTTVVIYSTAICSYCTQAKKLLEQKKIAYTEVRVDLDEKKRDEMIALSGRRTVPQIFINDKLIGGFDDLWALEQSGELDGLLKG
jgi:glutaredoxin 3